MNKYIDLSDNEDFGRVSSTIGRDYSNFSRNPNNGIEGRGSGDYIVRSPEYKGISGRLNNIVLEVARASKQILNTTAMGIHRTVSGINQDFGLSGSKLSSSAMMAISPMLAYAVGKAIDSGAFFGVFKKLKSGISTLFRAFFSWAGIDTSTVKSFVKGIMLLPFKLIGKALYGIMALIKLPFKSALQSVAWLVKLPWKIIGGTVNMLTRIVTWPLKLLGGVIKSPFKMLGGMFGLSFGRDKIKDPGLNTINNTLISIAKILGIVAIGLVGAKIIGRMSTIFRNGGMTFGFEGGAVSGQLRRFGYWKEDETPKQSSKNKKSGIFEAGKRAGETVASIAMETISESFQNAYRKHGPMPRRGKFLWLAKMGVSAGIPAFTDLSNQLVGTSWDAATMTLRTPRVGPEKALNEFTAKRRKVLEKDRRRRADDERWNKRFPTIDKFFGGWRQGEHQLPFMGRMLSGGLRTTVETPFGIGKFLLKSIVNPIEGAFRKVQTDPKVIETQSKGFFKSYFALLIPIAGALLGMMGGSAVKMLGGFGKMFGGMGIGALKLGGNFLTVYNLAQALWDNKAYTRKLTGKTDITGIDQTMATIIGVLTGGSSKGGAWDMIRGMAAGTAIGGFPWGTAIGGVAGLIGTENFIKLKDTLVDTGSTLGVAVYDALHAKTGMIAGMRAFFEVVHRGGGVGSAMAAYLMAYGGVGVPETVSSVPAGTRWKLSHPGAQIPVGATSAYYTPTFMKRGDVTAVQESNRNLRAYGADVHGYSGGAFQFQGSLESGVRNDADYLLEYHPEMMREYTKGNRINPGTPAAKEIYKLLPPGSGAMKKLYSSLPNTPVEMENQRQFANKIGIQSGLSSLPGAASQMLSWKADADPRLGEVLFALGNAGARTLKRTVTGAIGLNPATIKAMDTKDIALKLINFQRLNIDKLWSTAMNDPTLRDKTQRSLSARWNEEESWFAPGMTKNLVAKPVEIPVTPAAPGPAELAKTSQNTQESAANLMGAALGTAQGTSGETPAAQQTNNIIVTNTGGSTTTNATTNNTSAGQHSPWAASGDLRNLINGEVTVGN